MMPGHSTLRFAAAIALFAALFSDAMASQPSIVKAVWASEPPRIDGRVDDACWQEAPAATGFLLMHTDLVAPYQALGYFAHDDAQLYVGVKCLKTHGAQPHGAERTRDDYFFADDLVEILIDPGGTGERYYQFVVNAYGSPWETARSAGGAKHDPRWRADWQAAAVIEDDYWSLEAAIPYYNFGALSDLNRDWSINLCRQSHTPYAYSSIAPQGVFHDPKLFAKLTGLRGPFDRYEIDAEDAYVRREPSIRPPLATLRLPVTNTGNQPRSINIKKFAAGEPSALHSQTVILQPGATFESKTAALELEPLLSGRNDVYLVRSRPTTDRLVVADSESGRILAQHYVREPHYLEVMSVEVADPWHKKLGTERTHEVSLDVTIGLDKEILQRGSLQVTLHERSSRSNARASEQGVAERKIDAPHQVTSLTFPVHDVDWGTYSVVARFLDHAGQEICSAHEQVNVLPGPPHHVVVLNNFVSELTDTRVRGLTGQRRIELMNPRDGWIWFQLEGSGSARIEGQNIRLEAGEAMHRLAAGRYVLLLEAPDQRLIARAVPEIMYTQFPSGPGTDGYDVNLYMNRQNPQSLWTPGAELGRYNWEFLQQHVLNNCNVIVGDTDQPNLLADWTKSGRKWMTTTGAPGYHLFGPAPGKFATAVECVRYWTKSPGYSHPLASGGIADDCSNATERQFVEWARAMRLIAEDPQWADHRFYPWASWAFGSDGSRAFLRSVVELGWKYAFYQFLPEQPSEADARQLFEQGFALNARSFNGRSWQSVRNMIATLGIMSHPPLSQNVDPAVDFRSHMDLQMHALANHPAFFGLYGVQWYYSAYADEENARWAGHLYRHYCIEGRTDRATEEPYRLDHITNPDFEQATRGWTVESAESGSVRAEELSGYGESLQGRYLGGSRGDKFLVFKRSGQGPNQISQTMRNLEPGRLYSIKMITADWRDIYQGRSKKKPTRLRIGLAGATMESRHRTNYWFTFPINWGNKLGEFNYQNRAYLTYHWYVFRAEAAQALLTISDWLKNNEPGGPIGQEVMVNFVEVQPYFEGPSPR